MGDPIIDSVRSDMAEWYQAGFIDKAAMREFEKACPPLVREFSAADVKQLREKLECSHAVFAGHLHLSIATVRRWEQGKTRPSGPALKLLNVIADKGFEVILC